MLPLELQFCGEPTGYGVVVFRLVVFRPFTSEVIVAKVKSSDEDGIRRTFSFANPRGTS
jgi:DNA-directed RNA polymerase subunit E'/Rpb7